MVKLSKVCLIYYLVITYYHQANSYKDVMLSVMNPGKNVQLQTSGTRMENKSATTQSEGDALHVTVHHSRSKRASSSEYPYPYNDLFSDSSLYGMSHVDNSYGSSTGSSYPKSSRYSASSTSSPSRSTYGGQSGSSKNYKYSNRAYSSPEGKYARLPSYSGGQSYDSFGGFGGYPNKRSSNGYLPNRGWGYRSSSQLQDPNSRSYGSTGRRYGSGSGYSPTSNGYAPSTSSGNYPMHAGKGRSLNSHPAYSQALSGPSYYGKSASNNGGYYPPASAQGYYSDGGYSPNGGTYAPGANGFPPPSASYPPSAVAYPSAAAAYPSSGVGYLPSAGSYPPSAGGHAPPAAAYPPAAVSYSPSAAGYPPPAAVYPMSAGGYPMSPSAYPQSTGGYTEPGPMYAQSPGYSESEPLTDTFDEKRLAKYIGKVLKKQSADKAKRRRRRRSGKKTGSRRRRSTIRGRSVESKEGSTDGAKSSSSMSSKASGSQSGESSRHKARRRSSRRRKRQRIKGRDFQNSDEVIIDYSSEDLPELTSEEVGRKSEDASRGRSDERPEADDDNRRRRHTQNSKEERGGNPRKQSAMANNNNAGLSRFIGSLFRTAMTNHEAEAVEKSRMATTGKSLLYHTASNSGFTMPTTKAPNILSNINHLTSMIKAMSSVLDTKSEEGFQRSRG